jgi:hypothetical protein
LGKEIPETPFAKFAQEFVLRPWFKKVVKNKIKSHCTAGAVFFYKYEIFSEYTKKLIKILYRIRNLPQAPTCPGKTNAIFMV